MKIGIDARLIGTNHGGIGRYVFELSKHLLQIDQRNKYTFFYNSDGQEEIEKLLEINRNIKVELVNIRHYSLREQLKFHKVLEKENLDLVHFPNFNVPVMYKGNFVVTIHDMVHHKISGSKKTHLIHYAAYKYIIKHAAEKARKIITVSNYSKKEIEHFLEISPSKIKVIYQGISRLHSPGPEEVEKIKKMYLLSRPYFLFVGVLERKKNVVSLTRGFDVLMQKYGPKVDLVIAGKSDKHYPEIKHHALDIKNKNRLIFTGAVSEHELSCLYKGALAFTSSSLHEGFGLPGVEAMQFGLPLAVSNIEVFNEIYDDAGIYFDPLDTNDIAEKLHLLCKDEQFHKKLSERALVRSQMFDWQKTAQETLEVYEATMKGTAI